jgi:hypothetical protein
MLKPIKKTIEKKTENIKFFKDANLLNMLREEKELMLPCVKGTVLPFENNLIAFIRIRAIAPIVRIQMSSHVEFGTALEIYFPTDEDADEFVKYITVWNLRSKITCISRKNISGKPEDVKVTCSEDAELNTHFLFSFDNQSDSNRYYNSFVSWRDGHKDGDRFMFSVGDTPNDRSKLKCHDLNFWYAFPLGTDFKFIAKVAPIWPNVCLN